MYAVLLMARDGYTILKISVISAEEAKKEKKQETFYDYFFSLFFKLLVIETIYLLKILKI